LYIVGIIFLIFPYLKKNYVIGFAIEIAAIMLFYFVFSPPLTRFLVKTIYYPILYQQLDLFSFKNAINESKSIYASVSLLAKLAIYSGDYQTAINICVKELKKKQSLKNKYLYFSILSRAYFELGDIEKLNVICNKFNEFASIPTNTAKSKKVFFLMRYYECFAKRDYKACLLLCEQQLANKKQSNRLAVIELYFNYAIAFYKLGDAENSNQYFGLIIQEKTDLHLAALAQNYLDRLPANVVECCAVPSILPQEDFAPYTPEFISKRRKRRVFSVILLALNILLISALLVSQYVYTIKRQEERAAYEEKLDAALAIYYEDFEKCEFFDLYKDNIYLETLSLVKTETGLHLLTVITRDGNITFDVLMVCEDIEAERYYVEYGKSGNYIGFKITNIDMSAFDCYYLCQFELYNQTYWFYIDYIETTPKN
jgi:hypothetical protein